jgi:hypothetical protein
VNTITLSYTFFEMPGGKPAPNTAPEGKLNLKTAALNAVPSANDKTLN